MALDKEYAIHVCSVAAAYVLNILTNVASQKGWFGRTNLEVSKLHPTPITPAGWAFSIWGIIFMLQGAGVVALFFTENEDLLLWKQRIVRDVCRWWIVGWVFQCLWQYSFSRNTRLSLTMCAGLLIVAAMSFQVALAGVHALQSADVHLGKLPLSVFIMYFVPTAINAAWLSVATSVGIVIAAQLYLSHVNFVAIGLSIAISLVGVHLSLRHHDTFYGLTLVWSFVAVYANQKGRNSTLALVAALAVAVMVPVTIVATLRRVGSRDDVPEGAEALMEGAQDIANEAQERMP